MRAENSTNPHQCSLAFQQGEMEVLLLWTLQLRSLGKNLHNMELINVRHFLVSKEED
jgi:hypothetical protein